MIRRSVTPMTRSILIAFAALSLVPSASAMGQGDGRSCGALAKQVKADSQDVQARQAAIETLASDAELAGEAWENAEALRAFSPEQAAEADALKADYETSRTTFETAQIELSERASALNTDIAAYNARCVRD